ncbi:protein-arginine N5-methyltransferase [Sporobolomyces koalae]|uniref:protein-arginine N5-methyltransferase n=1 Tax=Sporobolomyces koalae TaxID=500713 RepID=UPI00316DE9ED
MPAQLNNYSVTPGVSVTTTNTFEPLSGPSNEDLDNHHLLSLRLIDAILERDQTGLIEKLVVEERVDCWVSDERQGWTCLHAAAYVGDVKLLKLLLRKGNAVWNLVDNLGCSAGDIAYSMNNSKAYKFLMDEGVRAEMLRAVMEDAADANNDDDDDEVEPGPDSEMTESESAEPAEKPSTASSLSHYLSQPLTYVTDSAGQEICLDAEGNGVMMGWEKDIMRDTVKHMLEQGWGDRKGKSRDVLIREEDEEDRAPLRTVNVGFGLGIIDTFLQEYSPTTHLIIEPHPSVLQHAKATGWYSKAGVRFFEGTWQQWIKALEAGEEEWIEWDAIYFDTYSEHYQDLRSFLSQTPNLLSSSSPDNLASVSFFHGLGATSRSFYDIYTTVSSLHLLEFGLKTEWFEVEVLQEESDVWETTAYRGEAEGGKGERKKYWEWEKAVGKYRLPISRLEY